jgi:AcrR family transcriptional regulator
LFADNGITNTSVRDIAAAAGVDPAIVIRHFGSKEALFLQTMSVGAELPGLVDGPVPELGTTILRRLIQDRQDSLLPVYRALLGALDRPDVRRFVETMLEQQLVQPILGRLTGPDRELRARLVAAQINGLLLTLALAPHTLHDTPIDHLLDTYAPALQALIDDTSQ